MANYLFITNSSKFCIDNTIITVINKYIKNNFNSNYSITELSPKKAYQWKIEKKIINKTLLKNLKKLFVNSPVDLNYISIDTPRKKKLLLADMDSTMIKEETLDEIAELLGIKNEVKKITTLAMNGDIEFDEALIKRVKLLKNLPLEVIFNFRKNLNFSDGGIELISSMKTFGAKTILISGGFHPIVNFVAEKLKFDFCHGNQFLYKENKNGVKVLNGKIKLPIINSNSKIEFLKKYQNDLKISSYDTIAVGDGANDVQMIKGAGIGVSFNGKKILQKNADVVFNHTNLKGVLYIQGIKEKEINKII